MRKFQKEQSEKKKTLFKHLIKVGVGFLVVLVVLEIWAINRIADYGQQITELKKEQASLQYQNQVLESSIAQKASLHEASQKAQKLGFLTIKNIEYLKEANLASNF